MPVRALAAGLAALLLAAACGGGGQGAPTQLSASRLFEVAKPAIVLVYAQWSATLTVPDGQLTDPAKNQIIQTLAAEVNAGQLADNQQAIMTAFVQQLTAHIFDYVVPDPNPDHVSQYPAKPGAIGSGFVVTPDGTVVTNAHVAAPGDDTVHTLLVNSVLNDVVKKELAGIVQAQISLPDDVLKAYLQAYLKWVLKYVQFGNITTTLTAFTGAAVPGVLDANKGLTAELVTAGQPVPGKDVAILKIEGQHDMPTMALGDDAALQTGDRLFVVGYPGAATFNPLLKKDQSFEPSLTSGLVSGRKQLDGGWSAIQTDAATTHGNSGGPVVNAKGEAVGVLTFGSVDLGTGQEIQGFNFAVPTSIVKEFLAKAGVRPAQSRTSQLFVSGLNAYDQGHYRIAHNYFTEADALAPGNAEIQDRQRQAEQQVSQGKDQTPFYYCWLNACPNAA
ncbi:MAG: trypsin-like peptidase domain-containing protein [Candidatus Dormibacteraeota bacterium]|nr:trypsin-like peptidase domain-containing protein [Candidatus Dormibacteraeota bacterium]